MIPLELMKNNAHKRDIIPDCVKSNDEFCNQFHNCKFHISQAWSECNNLAINLKGVAFNLYDE